MKLLALSPLASCLATSAIFIFMPRQPWLLLCSLCALGAIAYALHRAWELSSTQDVALPPQSIAWIRTHILCHLVPLIYIGLLFFPSGQIQLPTAGWLIVMVPFFWSGRQTWQSLHSALGSKLYALFKRGNTAMLIVPALITGTGHALELSPLTDLAPKVLLLYLTIHFMIIGLAVAKIDQDITMARSPQPRHPANGHDDDHPES